MKKIQKEQPMMKAQPKTMKKPTKPVKAAQKKWSGWRNFIDRYCAL